MRKLLPPALKSSIGSNVLEIRIIVTSYPICKLNLLHRSLINRTNFRSTFTNTFSPIGASNKENCANAGDVFIAWNCESTIKAEALRTPLINMPELRQE